MPSPKLCSLTLYTLEQKRHSMSEHLLRDLVIQGVPIQLVKNTDLFSKTPLRAWARAYECVSCTLRRLIDSQYHCESMRPRCV
jgi:hypothetical protein